VIVASPSDAHRIRGTRISISLALAEVEQMSLFALGVDERFDGLRLAVNDQTRS